MAQRTPNNTKAMTGEELGQKLLQSIREMKSGKAAHTCDAEGAVVLWQSGGRLIFGGGSHDQQT